MANFKTKLRHASPAILACLSIAGVVGTTVMAVKETPKALRLVKAKKDELQKEELTPAELVQTTWQCYIPSALMGFGTITCIVGVSILSKHNQAALASAYAMINESYKQYRQATKKVYGADADSRILAEMAKDAYVYTSDWGNQVYNMDMDPDSEILLFYDLVSQRYFNTTMAAVLNAQYHVNRNLIIRGDCSLNEYISFLGLDGVEHGDEFGWDLSSLYADGLSWLDFDNQKETMEDGLECIVIGACSNIVDFESIE